MALVAGARLGPDEIVAPLGAGGMGEVYRARDTKLGREVAVKVLPEGFAQDPDRGQRFLIGTILDGPSSTPPSPVVVLNRTEELKARVDQAVSLQVGSRPGSVWRPRGIIAP